MFATHVKNLLTTKFKYWDACVQSEIMLRFRELLDSIPVITGIQLLTNDVWNKADDFLKGRLMAKALQSMIHWAHSYSCNTDGTDNW